MMQPTKGNSKATNEMLGFTEDEDGTLKIDDIIIPPPPAAFLSNEVPEERLIINQLKIKNFKSYANEIVLGPFNKNFTAVVGPNGSGKSNVIDSLLFVFGYKARKIRSKKLSHLIHKSAKYPNLNSCCVTVKFAMIKEFGSESENFEIVDDSKFVLSRTAFIDDTSYYEVNGKRTPYKDVAKMLRCYGVDLEHSRFLILQGEIEAISLMNPKAQNEHECGYLEYVEDIVGSNRYIEPIKTFAGKVEVLNEEKKEKLNILKLSEKERDDLEEPKNKALQYLRMENKATLLENSLFQWKKWTAEKELESISSNKKELTETLNNVKNELNSLKEEKKSLEQELDKVNSDLNKYQEKLDKSKESYKTAEREDAGLLEEIKHVKAKKTRLVDNIAKIKNDLTKLLKKAEIHEQETSELEIMKTKLAAEKAKAEVKMSDTMDSMQKETKILQEKKDKLESEFILKKNKANKLKSEIELSQSECEIYLRTEKKEKQALEKLISEIEKAKQNSVNEEKILKSERERIAILEDELTSLNEELSSLQQKEISMQDQLKMGRIKYEDAKNSLYSFRNQSGMMQAFTKEKEKGRLLGVFGRLGDLGGIDEKYDVAISTVCGQLDNIVTDTLETAQQCVEFLKRNNLGYATFIPLDKMEKWIPYAHSKITTPENVPRLYDLIRVNDQRVLPAFYFALRDTLVANNLEQATRIGLQGRQRYRVVTLKGEVIDLSGTMSGGGGRVLRGRMGQTAVQCSHTPEEVSKMGAELENLTKTVSEVRRNVLNFKEQIDKKSKELSQLQLSIRKRQANYKTYIASVEMLEPQVEEQQKKILNVSVDKTKIEELQQKIETASKTYAAASKEASVSEEQLKKIQSEIVKISKGAFSKVKLSVEQLNSKINEVSQSMTVSAANAKKCKRDIKKSEEKIKNMEAELQGVLNTQDKLRTQRDLMAAKGVEFKESQAIAEENLEKTKSLKLEVKKKFDKFNENEHQKKMAEIKYKNDLKECEVLESEKKSYVKSICAKMSKLKMNVVEDDPTELPNLSEDEINSLNPKRISSEIEVTKAMMEESKPDLRAIEEFRKKAVLCEEKQKDLDEVISKKNLETMRYDELRKRRLNEFMTGFTIISMKVAEIYQMLTLGGAANMEIIDVFDPFSKGIDFSVRPPKKSWKQMRNLSGGEKTLSSLSLVFALHYYRPTPFYVMDEIDAALDVKNVAIVGYYLKELQKNTQFVIVSLRNIMNELSDHLIGIYKINNCSRNISIMNAGKWKDEDKEKENSKN